MQAALFGLLFLSEKISTAVLGAITISVFGVMLISVARITITPRSIITALFTKTALIGLSSGAIFGIAAVAYRAASLALEGPNYIIQASVTLSFAIIMQSIILMVWIYVKDRAEIARIRAAWKTGLLVGLFGASASFGWFMAMTLQQSALVKAVAQVEMLFAFATSIFIFKEDINKYEILGCGLFVCGLFNDQCTCAMLCENLKQNGMWDFPIYNHNTFNALFDGIDTCFNFGNHATRNCSICNHGFGLRHR
jgi:drug/metabolite transporter (DMT)-like permease